LLFNRLIIFYLGVYCLPTPQIVITFPTQRAPIKLTDFFFTFLRTLHIFFSYLFI